MPGIHTNRLRHLLVAWEVALSLFLWGSCRANGASLVQHNLQVELSLESKKLTVHDEISVNDSDKAELEILMAPQATIKSVSINKSNSDYSFNAGRLIVPVDSDADRKPLVAGVAFEAVFNDPLPENPASFDNPGFGVTGTITDKGACLLPGSGWYPHLAGHSAHVSLKVVAPLGIYAVTSGQLLAHEDREGRTISLWEIDNSAEGLPLAAGPYVVHSMMAGRIPIITYFYSQTDSLSDKYLKAAASHIQFFENLHGPYPFPKFAVVENFFPTGYGFPSFTLLGTSVLRLPFIPETSLKHEVAHSWWGNGVLVNYDSGNWCEGLTTYVADYLSQEMASSDDGRLYRQQILRDFTTLVSADEDIPLSEFSGRVSPATRAVGYGKAAFVFHMVRQKLGDDLFWESLRRIFKERLFLRTSWEDFRDVFVEVGKWEKREAQEFFHQWLTRVGGPQLELQGVFSGKDQTGWNAGGVLVQKEPFYTLSVGLGMHTVAGNYAESVNVKGRSSPFSFHADHRPDRLAVDPEVNLFRPLYPQEIPVTVNSVKGSRSLLPVLSDSSLPGSRDVFQLILESLEQGDLSIVRAEDVDDAQMNGKDFLFFNFPRAERLQKLFSALPEGLALSPQSFSLEGVFASGSSDCLFVAYGDPKRGGKLVGLFLTRPGTDEASVAAAARKITHYGKYSFVSFLKGTNVSKGIWPLVDSPLIAHLKENP